MLPPTEPEEIAAWGVPPAGLAARAGRLGGLGPPLCVVSVFDGRRCPLQVWVAGRQTGRAWMDQAAVEPPLW
jgi:hypothetical protein